MFYNHASILPLRFTFHVSRSTQYAIDKGDLMNWKVSISLLLILAVLGASGCGDNRYHDPRIKMEIQKLDSDLEDRWSTTGVVVISVDPNGPASRAQLEVGELISYVIGERAVNSSRDYNQAADSAMKEDNNFILKFSEGRKIRLAVRRKGDKVGLSVDGNRVSKVTPGSPAATAEIQVGNTIKSVVDERNIKSIKDYKEAIREFAKHNAEVTFRTTELIGIKIAAVSALGHLGDAQALDVLMELLERPGSSLREPAATALERLVALSQLNDLFQKFQQANVNELPADRLDSRQRESAEVLGLLAVNLEKNRATLEEPYGTHFRDRSKELYQKVTDGRLAELAQKYIKRESEPNQEIRRSCISILGQLKPESAIEELIAVMEDSREIPGTRFKAGLALGQIGPAAVEPLIAAFNRGDVSVKDIAASALGNIGGDKARNVLIQALETIEDPTIKLTVADAIAKIGDEAAIRTLRTERQRLEKGSGLGIFLDELIKRLGTRAM